MTGTVPLSVLKIKEALNKSDSYEIVPLNELLPTERYLKHQALQFIRNQGIGLASSLYSCIHTGNVENMHFCWRLPEEVDLEAQSRAVDRVRKMTPQQHSRLVKQSFVKAASKLQIQPKYSRYLYKLATNDATAPSNAIEKEVDSRILRYVEMGDEEVVLDLRAVVQQNASVYDEFFSQAQSFIDAKIGTAVDDRRQDSVVHLAMAMSAADLYRYKLLSSVGSLKCVVCCGSKRY